MRWRRGGGLFKDQLFKEQLEALGDGEKASDVRLVGDEGHMPIGYAKVGARLEVIHGIVERYLPAIWAFDPGADQDRLWGGFL